MNTNIQPLHNSPDIDSHIIDAHEPRNKPKPQKWLRCPQREEEIKRLCRANGNKHLLYATPYIAIYLAAIYFQLIIDSLWLNIALSFVLGNQLYVLFVLHHDCMHGSAFRNDFFNRLVGRLYSLTFVMTFTVNRETHKRHHAYIADPERDPDEYYFSGTTGQIWLRIWRYIEWYTRIALIRYGKKVHDIIIIEQVCNVVFWTAIHLILFNIGMGAKVLYIFWLPMCVVALIINPITRGYEHSPITMYPKDDARRLDMSKNSVTVANRWLGYLWANITYHVEHHAYARCPAYNLQKLHRIFQEEKLQYLTAPYPLYGIWHRNKMPEFLTMKAGRKKLV